MLQRTIREIHQRLRALETREYAEVVGPSSVINAQYLTLALHAVLTAERRFVDGDGLVGTDAGANADYTLDIDLVAAWSGLEFVAGELRIDEDADFTWTGTHTFNANILLAGGVTIDGMDPSAFLVTYAAHDHSAGDPTQVDHTDLVGVAADQHHAEVHVVNSTGPHAEAGLAAGNVLRASGAAAFAFAQLQHGDLGGVAANQHHTQIHDVVGGDHTLTGAQFVLVGATAVNTIGLLTPLSDVSAPAEAILKSNAAGSLTLVDLTLTDDLLLADGAVIGITGNEIITFNAAGTIVVSGAHFGIETTPAVPLHVVRTGAAMQYVAILANMQALAADVGSRLGFRGIGPSDMCYIEAAWEGVAGTDTYLTFSTKGGGVMGERVRITSAGFVGIGTDTPNELLEIKRPGGGNVIQLRADYPTDNVWNIYIDSGGMAFREAAAFRVHFLDGGNVIPGANKTQDLGISGTAWDDCWADDFHNEPDYYYMDSRRNRIGETVLIDDLAIIRGIKPSGEWDARTGLPLIDDVSLPDWIFTRDKETGETLYGPDGKPWLSLKMSTSLTWGAIRQLDGHRLNASIEREMLIEQIGIMQNRLAVLEQAARRQRWH